MTYEKTTALGESRGVRVEPPSRGGDNNFKRESRKCLASMRTGQLYIEPGSPWQNGYWMLNEKLRDECANGEIFYSLKEAHIVIERWWRKTKRGGRTRHRALGRWRRRPKAECALQVDLKCLTRIFDAKDFGRLFNHTAIVSSCGSVLRITKNF